MNNTNKYRLLLLAALLITGLLSSCLKENFEDCPRPFQVTIKALDADLNDITGNGDVQQVILFVFNEQGQVVNAFELSADQIKNRKPVDIKMDFPGHKNLTFVAWGNLDGKVDFSQINTVKQMQDLYVKLKQQNGTAQTPGDLFHGSLNVPVEYGGTEYGTPQVVEITRKTAGVTITTVKLRPWNGNKEGVYSYVVRESLDTYDKDGNLTGNPANYSPQADFQPNGDFFAPIFYTFPPEPGKSFVVDILYNGEVIFTAEADSEGNPFVPQVGRTLNIIIVLSTHIQVKTMVTPWNVVYQYVTI